MSSLKALVILLPLLLFVGCGIKQPETVLQPNQKAFEAEDEYILKALDYEASKEYGKAIENYKYLYAHSGKWEYNLKVLKLLMSLKKYDEAESEIQKALLEKPGNEELMQTLVSIAIHQKAQDKALKYALELIEQHKTEQNYEMVASIYFGEKLFDEALHYLESAYAIDNSPQALEKITNTLYYFMDKRDEATAYMESHIRIHGCEQRMCEKLARLYRGQKDVPNMLAVFKRLYENYKDPLYAKNIVELYIYLKQYDNAIDFLKRTHVDDSMLLEIYRAKKDFKSAQDLASKLAIETNEMDFLAQSAIFEYENAKDKNDPAMLRSVTTKLYKSLESLDSDVYQNFLGYILIDHDLDYEEGMRLVNLALEKKPDSAYYIDSLAWGYFKLKECEKAYEYMKQVVDMVGLEEEEVKDHWEKIKACYSPEEKKEEQL